MNMHRNQDDSHARFDMAMRALHHDALEQLTPAVRWRLKPGSDAGRVTAERFESRRMGPVWAGAVAAVCAVAVGVGLWRTPDPLASADAPALVAVDESATVLGEDPDFYAWLASDDAELVAME